MRASPNLLNALLSLALLRASREWDDLSPLLQKIALDLAMINGDLNGSQKLLKMLVKRHEEKAPIKHELQERQGPIASKSHHRELEGSAS